METVAQIIRALMGVMSVWFIFFFLYQLFISFFGFKRKTKDYEDFDPKLRFLVLVPAHNEETVIADIINNLKHMEYPRELYDFYILADNCTDRTADVARQMGANVIESFKASPDAPTGKPVVLQKTLEAMAGYQDKYDMVMFFDADNLIDPNMFLEVNSQYLSHEGKVAVIQCYLGSKNKNGLVALFYYMFYTINNRFIQFAKGRLGLNGGIGGTGFAVSTEYLYQRGGWSSMSLTEDFELQIEATCDGQRILWNHNVRIYDEKPTKLYASLRQRIRWAQGHWYVVLKNTKRLFRAIKNKQISCKEFASTFLTMYSLTTYVVWMLNLLLGLILLIFEWVGLISVPEVEITLQSWASVNLPGLLVFLYSFILLFFVGDYMDNSNRFRLRTLFPMVVSVLLNTVVVLLAQFIGLCKYKKQTVWDKTEHSINRLNESMLLPQQGPEPTLELVPENTEKTA